MKRILIQLRTLLRLIVEHDVLNSAKAVAYSGMLMFFPAVMVLAALLSLVPQGNTLMDALRGAFEQFFPDDTMALVQASLVSRKLYSVQVLLAAAALSLFAGIGVMLSLMEGFRRAYSLSSGGWGFWRQRQRALLLVPIVLAPLALASLLLVFGRQIEGWTIAKSGHNLRLVVLFLWRLTRWAISAGASVGVMGLTYHFGTCRTEHWCRVLNGAVAATALWFPATLLLGWYVARVANYSLFYGSFGAGIATLVWIYLTAFSVLLGAEINGLLFAGRSQDQDR